VDKLNFANQEDRNRGPSNTSLPANFSTFFFLYSSQVLTNPGIRARCGTASLLSQAALRRSKQDDHEFKDSLGYTVSMMPV
jgi:hypothetical protein